MNSDAPELLSVKPYSQRERKMLDEIELAKSKLEAITKFIDAQAGDLGLWGEAEYASEAYIQRGLRGCHAFIESVIKSGPRPETTNE